MKSAACNVFTIRECSARAVAVLDQSSSIYLELTHTCFTVPKGSCDSNILFIVLFVPLSTNSLIIY